VGRQIQIAMTSVDEEEFLAFLRESADIAIFGSFTQAPDDLWVDGFSPELMGHWTYHIWNKAYLWWPEYGRTYKAENPDHRNFFYVSNSNDAPVIEFGRSDVARRKYGRIYWSKYFAAPRGLDYDVDSFGKWFDKIVRWVRKNGRKDHDDYYSPYFLPDAWQLYKSTSVQGP